MASENEASDTGAGVGPQTPAARRRAHADGPQDPGVELSALEESAAQGLEFHGTPSPGDTTEPAAPAATESEPPAAPASEYEPPAAPSPGPEPPAALETEGEHAGPEPPAALETEGDQAGPEPPAAPVSESEPPAALETEGEQAVPSGTAIEPQAIPQAEAGSAAPHADEAEPAGPPAAEAQSPALRASEFELRPARATEPESAEQLPPELAPLARTNFRSRPPRRPARPRPSAPASRRERAAALLALGSATGVLLFLLLSLGSSRTPVAGLGDFGARPSLREVAPGGWVALSGSDAPERTSLVLETRADDGGWRTAGRAESDRDGDFRLEGRVLARPGRLMLRARAPGVGSSAPVVVTVRPLRLASVGDINLGDAPGATIEANGPRYPWASAGNALRRADIAFGNLECAVSERGEPFPKQFNFRGTPAALEGLRRSSGIDVLNLANNHVGDFGREATVDTVGAVERLGMRAVGAGPDQRRALAPQVVERLGLRVAFVGFSSIAPLEFAAGDDSPGTAWASAHSVTKAVRAARRRADVVVATFHWGIEKAPFESAEQRVLAQTAAAAGANLVIGAHPHVLQPLRREGGALVAYSLGNFVFGASSSETAATGILVTDLTAEGVGAARWRAGRIVSSRPVMDDKRPRRLPVRDERRLAAGVSL